MPVGESLEDDDVVSEHSVKPDDTVTDGHGRSSLTDCVISGDTVIKIVPSAGRCDVLIGE